MEYISMGAIKAQHQGHFFDRGAMRFFDSRFSRYGVILADGSTLFVTSERFDHNTLRRYTVRMQDATGSIVGVPSDRLASHRVYTFQQYASSVSAWRALRRLVRELEQ